MCFVLTLFCCRLVFRLCMGSSPWFVLTCWVRPAVTYSLLSPCLLASFRLFPLLNRLREADLCSVVDLLPSLAQSSRLVSPLSFAEPTDGSCLLAPPLSPVFSCFPISRSGVIPSCCILSSPFPSLFLLFFIFAFVCRLSCLVMSCLACRVSSCRVVSCLFLVLSCLLVSIHPVCCRCLFTDLHQTECPLCTGDWLSAGAQHDHA
jgi:hypothetical protein